MSPWEHYIYALGVLDREPEEARRALHDEGVASYPDNGMVYNLAS